MTVTDLFEDSSVWISYFFGEHKLAAEMIEQEGSIFISALTLFEVKRRLMRDSSNKKLVEKQMTFMQNRSIIMQLGQDIAIKAAEVAKSEQLHMADALIYTAALERDARFFTADPDFKGKANVLFLS